MIWHNQLAAVSPCIRNLTRLIVHGCEKLKYCFTSSVIGNFVQLQHLEICYCTILEEIVGKERGEEATATFDFPKVTFLKLWNLSELRTFYPGIHTSEWPSLKKLEVYGCDKVDIFTSEYLSFQETSEESQINIPTQQALFLVEKVSSHLEELKLSGKDIAVISHGQLPKHLFRNLKILEVLNNKSESCSIDFLQRFNNLEKLELRCSSYKEVFSYKEVEKHAGTRTQIKSLKLWKLSDLMHLWKQDSKLDSVVENLEILEVWWCDNLVNLVPSSASFGNLTTLRLWYCKGLKNLVTSFTAKSLVRLVELRIDGCKMMTEIISNEGDVAEDEIIFSKLKLLSLEHLDSLTSFHSGNYTFKFPSLEHLFVIDCPNMKIFSSSDLTTPMLREVQQNWGLENGCWEADLNATIQQLHKKKSPSQLMSTDPSFSLAEATNIDMLSSNLTGSHKTQEQEEHQLRHRPRQWGRSPSMSHGLESFNLDDYLSQESTALDKTEESADTHYSLNQGKQQQEQEQEHNLKPEQDRDGDGEDEGEEEEEEVEGSKGEEKDHFQDQEQISFNEINSQMKRSNVDRTESDTKQASGEILKMLPKKMKKSASSKSAFNHFKDKDIVEVEASRPATVKELGNPKVTQVDEEEVNAKADDFINKFKQQLKSQRIDSITRYKEMINRDTGK